MKQLTNEVYRTKRKLKLLEEDGIGQLLVDFNKMQDKYIKEEEVSGYIKLLKSNYLKIMQDYKPSKQIKIEYNG